jgi:hypothetical protein
MWLLMLRFGIIALTMYPWGDHMLRLTRTAAVTLAAVALGASALVGAAPAGAYPAGTDLDLVVRSQSVQAGQRIALGIRNGQPGCTVTLRLRAAGSNQVLGSASATVGPRGRAAKTLALPDAAGRYVVVGRQSGAGCLRQSAEVRFRAS